MSLVGFLHYCGNLRSLLLNHSEVVQAEWRSGYDESEGDVDGDDHVSNACVHGSYEAERRASEGGEEGAEEKTPTPHRWSRQKSPHVTAGEAEW